MHRHLRALAPLRAFLAAPLLAFLPTAAILPGSTAVQARNPRPACDSRNRNAHRRPGSFRPSVAVVVGEESYLVDAGAGVVRRAAAAARNGIAALAPSNLKRVFITHLHSDHTSGSRT